MISSPSGYASLDIEQEWRKLKDAVADLESRGLVVLERMENPTLIELQHRLRNENIHIFHFIGHGGFDEAAQDGVLVLETDDGKANLTSGKYLGTLLHDEKSIRLAVLNACEGGRTSRHDPFAGVGQSLVQQGIPAVVAMQFEISDQAAITLSHEFYAALADGYPVDAALAEARKAIFAQNNIIEWGTPVLYMRGRDGQIFNLASQPGVPASQGPHPLPVTSTPFTATGVTSTAAPPRAAAVESTQKSTAAATPSQVLLTSQPVRQTAAPPRTATSQSKQGFVVKSQETADASNRARTGRSNRPLLALIAVMALAFVAVTATILSHRDSTPARGLTTPQGNLALLATVAPAPIQAALALPVEPTATRTSQPVATAPPTATSAPIAVTLPTDTPQPAEPSIAAFSAAQNVNVRSGPGTNYPIIGRLTTEKEYAITGTNSGGNWWQFVFNGQPAWVSMSVVQSTGPVAAVAVVQAPPPPTPTPAPTSTPQQTTCRIQPGPTFARVWDRTLMGCPQGTESGLVSAYELFERGWMLWRQDRNTDHWAFFNAGGYAVTQYPSGTSPEFSCAEAKAAGMPVSGFGRMWCEKTDIRTRIGRALAKEVGNNRPLQVFEDGFMILIKERGTIVSVYTDGTWSEQR